MHLGLSSDGLNLFFWVGSVSWVFSVGKEVRVA